MTPSPATCPGHACGALAVRTLGAGGPLHRRGLYPRPSAGLSAAYQGQATQPLLTDLGLLSLEVVPDTPNGAGLSQVQVPLAQVSVDYRLPE